MRSPRPLLVLSLLFAAALPAPAQAPPPVAPPRAEVVAVAPLRQTYVPVVASEQLRLQLRHDSLDQIADSLELAYISAVQLDSIRAATAAIAHHDSLVAWHLIPRPRTYTPALPAIAVESYVGFTTAGVLYLNDRLHFDVDPGGYRDRWRSSDKLLHATLAYGATDACSALGGRAFMCAAIVTVGGMAYERTQGFYSSRDAWANAGGALLSATVNTWLRR